MQIRFYLIYIQSFGRIRKPGNQDAERKGPVMGISRRSRARWCGKVLLGVLLAGSGVAAQTVTPGPGTPPGSGTLQITTPSTIDLSQNPYLGGVPVGQAVPGVMDLSLTDVLNRALRQNLGLLLQDQGSQEVRAARIRALAELLPDVRAGVTESLEQVNLLAEGVPASFLRGASPISGPFAIFDARTVAIETLSFGAYNRLRAARQNFTASRLDVRNARDLVVLFVGAGYIQVLSNEARIDAIQAQLVTARTLYQQAVDMRQAA